MKLLAVELGIDDYVTFTGRVPDAELLAMLNTADVCVNPDVANEMNDKSTMNKIMEYMALGKPIVQFDLTEGRFSARTRPSMPRATTRTTSAAKIVELIDDPERRAGHGRLRAQARRERARVELRGAEAARRLRLPLRAPKPGMGPEERVPLKDAATFLLDECRMVLPGIQALFGFQLIAVFNERFAKELSRGEQCVHFVGDRARGVAIAIIMTPAAIHRRLGVRRVTERFLVVSTRLLLASMVPLALGIALDFYLIARLVVDDGIAGAARPRASRRLRVALGRDAPRHREADRPAALGRAQEDRREWAWRRSSCAAPLRAARRFAFTDGAHRASRPRGKREFFKVGSRERGGRCGARDAVVHERGAAMSLKFERDAERAERALPAREQQPSSDTTRISLGHAPHAEAAGGIAAAVMMLAMAIAHEHAIATKCTHWSAAASALREALRCIEPRYSWKPKVAPGCRTWRTIAALVEQGRSPASLKGRPTLPWGMRKGPCRSRARLETS
jgi:hypothetical protein